MTTLAAQAAAMRHVHAIARRSGDCADRVLNDAAAAIRTIDWLNNRPDLMALIKLVDAFRGGELIIRDAGGENHAEATRDHR